MAGAFVSYINLFDTAPSISLSAGAIAAYPLANLRTRQLSTVCRMTAASTPKITVDFGAPLTFNTIALLNCNISPGTSRAAALTVEASSNGSSWVSTMFALPADLGNPNLPQSLMGWMPDLTGSANSKLTIRYLRFTPSWTRAGGVNYYEIGRLWIGDSIVFPSGCDAGWTLSTIDPGAVDESAGGQYYADPRQKGRQLFMPCAVIPTTVAYGFDDNDTSAPYTPSIDDLFATVGNTGEVVACHKTDNPMWWRRFGIYGHLVDDQLTIAHQAAGYHSTQFTLKEEH
jgi:hypothetical protein